MGVTTDKYSIFGVVYDSNEIKNILYSKLLFTYRGNFPKIKNTYITNDIGWGCTIRSGQMLIGNTLIRKKFGLEWEYNKSTISNEYHKIIYNFQDNYDGIFSFHNIIEYYNFIGQKPGDWIGPYSFCKILEKLSKHLLDSKIKYYNFVDSELDLSKIEKLDDDISYLVTFPVRLGLKEISSQYYTNIMYLTNLKQFNGIIGGNNKSSYFFLGSDMNNNLIYFDPHIVKEYNIIDSIENEFHTTDFNYLNIESLSPTFSISFYCNNYQDLNELIVSLNNIPDKKYPIISINNIQNKECSSYTINVNEDEWEFIE